MQRYFAKDDKLTLENGDYHHIKDVMRMKRGDIIEVVYDKVIYKCVLTDVKSVHFKVIEKRKEDVVGPKIIVAFSLIKEQKQDYLLQKSTEAGAYKFIPIKTKRSVIKIDEKKFNSKITRWNKICKEASEQSFRTSCPLIEQINDIKNLPTFKADLKLLLTLNEKTKNIKKVLHKNNKYDTILIVIGPEGGFEKSEEDYLVDNGFIPVLLGNNVLRAESAAIVAISMINYEFMR